MMHSYLWSDLSSELQEQAEPARVALQRGKSVLLEGPAGSGKTMIARRLRRAVATDRELAEARVISRLAGLSRSELEPPFRAPHHTVSVAGMRGDGKKMLPGELSLAHSGILFLDEVPKFSMAVLHLVAEAKANKAVYFPTKPQTFALCTMPASFVLIGAANACPCGQLGGPRECGCSPREVERYQGRTRQCIHWDVVVPIA
jgi:magnesium chelatase family protein